LASSDAGKKKLWVAMEAGKDDLDKRWRTKLVAHYLDYLLGRRDPSGGDKHHHSPDYVMAAQFVTGIAIQAGLGLVELNKGWFSAHCSLLFLSFIIFDPSYYCFACNPC
jgi:hypothetical protein